MKGFIVYATYRIHDKKPYVYLFGRLENGESFLAINEYAPYFCIRKQDAEVAKTLTNFKIEEMGFKNKKGEEVVKIVVGIPADVPPLREKLDRKGIQTYEADILFERRYLIDNYLNSSVDIDGKFEKGENVNRIYKETKLIPAEYFPKLKILSFDLETDRQASTIYSIAMECSDFKKVLIVSDKKLEHAISFKKEKEMLEFFKKKLLELDPDVLTSHNVIDFDMKVLRDRFDANKIAYTFGRIPDRIRLKIESGFNRSSSADVPGRIVLDSLQLLKQFKVKLVDYSLETAAREILGEGKLIVGHNRVDEIDRMYKEDQQALVNYNLKDTELVLKILEKKKLVDICVEISLLTGIQPDKVKGKIVDFDSIYLKRMRKRGIVAPTAGRYVKEKDNVGGYVMESIPGIYECAMIFDFRSMYPSVEWTMGIDPLTLVDDPNVKPEKGKHVIAPNGAVFLNQDTIMGEIIEEFLAKRSKAKAEKNEVASEGLKVLMNSIFYGIFANPNCRWFSMPMAGAITTFPQELGHIVAKEMERFCREELKLKNAVVFYRDTDSFMVHLGIKDYDKAKGLQIVIRDHINSFLDKYIKDNFHRVNHMFLDAKRVYLKFVMPKLRKQDVDTEIGIKKKYCGYYIENGKDKIDFVGMEYIHTDVTDMAKKFQYDVYYRFFKGMDFKKVVVQFVKDLKDGKYDEMLVYRKNMSKDQSSYEKITPPHVKAARLLLQRKGRIESNLIEYVMTIDRSNGKKESTPEPVGFAKNPIDYDHYIEKQLRPAVEQLFELAGASFDEMIRDKRQKAMTDY